MLQSVMWFTGEPRLACSAHPRLICNLLNSVNAVDNCQVIARGAHILEAGDGKDEKFVKS